MPARALAALLLVVPAAPAAAEPAAARLDAVLRVEPMELPDDKRDGRRELAYAFGKKRAPEEARDALVRVLGDRFLFERVVGEGEADYSLGLRLSRARSSFEDFSAWQSRPSEYEVSADVAWAFRDRDGQVVADGTLPGSGRVEVREGPPRRPDAAVAWARLLEDAAVRAFTEAFEDAAFGNEPPPPGGWIAAEPGR